MTRFEPVAPTGATFTLAIIKMAFRAVVRTWTALKNRRQVTLLNQLDDRCLKDIGLIRSDVNAALCLPLSRDPSLHLAEMSGHVVPKHTLPSNDATKHYGMGAQPMPLHRLRRPDAVVNAQISGASKA